MPESVKRGMLIVVGSLVGLVLFVFGYEVVETVRYYQWRADFEGTAWLGAVTVPSDDPELMWEYRPHAKHKRIRTNNHGLRGPDVEVRKSQWQERVAFIGDSVTLGYGEEEGNIFVTVFEQEATRLDRRKEIQALNFGVDGYATPQIARLLETKVMDFQPDHVVYVMCLNDFDFTTSAGDKVRYFRKPGSFLWVKLEHLVRKLRGLDFHTHKFRKNRDEVLARVAAMADRARSERAEFHWVLLPIFPRQVHSFSAYPHQQIHDEIRAFAGAESIDFIDILDELRSRGGPPRAYSNDVWHPNVDGHRVIGEALLEILPEAEDRASDSASD